MNYSYEILKIEPRHKFLSVRYFADGKENYFKNFNLEDFSSEAIVEVIQNFFPNVKSHWDYQTTAAETAGLEQGVTGELTYTEPTPTPKNNMSIGSAKRLERNRLLQQTDWMMFSDTATPSQAWVDYRQALRDVTSQAGFPDSVTWPTKPE